MGQLADALGRSHSYSGEREQGRLDLGEDRNALIARSVLGEPNRHLSNRRELRWGRRGSLAFIPSRGVFFDNESGARGGVLDLIVYAGAAGDRREAARLLELDSDLPQRETPQEREERAAAEEERRRARMAVAAEIWACGNPIGGTVAEIYLRDGRRITAPLEHAALRAHPLVDVRPYEPDGRVSPAMLGLVVDARGVPMGAHITYLRPDGSGKADLKVSRKVVGTRGGGHVPLIPGDAAVVVGEGLESTFSAWSEAADLRGRDGLGACAALSANGMAVLEWPPGTRELIISPDRDENGAGERAARELARRANSEGLRVAYLWPPEGLSDWNAHAMRPEGQG